MNGAGPLALVGGAAWREGCTFDAELLAASGAQEVLVIAAAAAYEWPDRSVTAAQQWFEGLGAKVTGLPVLQRRDAMDKALADQVRHAKFIYLADGSAMHLRSVLKDTVLFEALVEAWKGGAVLAADSAAATVLVDPMVDPRGGAFTLGLGLIPKLTVVPHWQQWTEDKARRLTQLMPSGVVVAEIEERTALIRWSDGTWASSGMGSVHLKLDHQDVGLDILTGR